MPSSAPEISENVEFCAMTPLQVQNSLDKIHFIKNLIIGGAAVSEKLKNEISTTLQFSNSPTRIYETYGMSETLSHIALKQVFPVQEDYFTIFNDVEISVDERNCLVIEALELSLEKITTNDIVEILNATQFVLKGRIDNVINSGGIKIFPEEIEEILAKYISFPFFIASKPDEVLGEKVILVLEATPFSFDNSVFSELSKYQIPKD